MIWVEFYVTVWVFIKERMSSHVILLKLCQQHFFLIEKSAKELKFHKRTENDWLEQKEVQSFEHSLYFTSLGVD